ncbi:MAG: tetratricopeptide repeat protein [Verrucomicrobia bacterium]|nr:tetratricopeptide repeat protein [Verrucomicrobiota bacterium]
MNTNRNCFVYLGVLVALVALPYLTSLNGDFVYDDHGQIVENSFLLNPGHVADLLSLRTVTDAKVINGRRPVVLLTYFLDTFIWGDNALGYHLTNLLLHAGASCLLFLFLRRVMRQHAPDKGADLFALGAAVIFGLHPVLAEPVHVPSFRPDILCALFLFGYLLTALRVKDAKGALRVGAIFAGSLLLFVLALLSKETAVIAPLLAVWTWWAFPSVRPGLRRAAGIVIPSTALSILFVLSWRYSGSFQAVTGEWNGLSLRPPENFWSLPWIWTRYVGLLLWPHPLCIDRVLDPVIRLSDPRLAGGLAVLILSTAAALAFLRKDPLVSFGIGIMLIGFAPVSNVVPLFNPMADRYLYLVVPGFSIIISRILLYGGFKERKHRVLRKTVLGVILSTYIALTLFNLRFFDNDYLLWSRVKEIEPRSARASTWLGLEMKNQGRVEEALDLYAKAAELNPHDAAPLVNIAIIFGEMGQINEAERILRQAIDIRPDSAAAHWNLSVALQKQGRFPEALTEAERTVEIEPSHAQALRSLVILHVERGDIPGAKRAVEKMLVTNPQDRDALDALSYLNSR